MEKTYEHNIEIDIIVFNSILTSKKRTAAKLGETEEATRTRRGQTIANANDILLVPMRREITDEILKKIVAKLDKMELELNEEKTKKVICGGRTDSSPIKIWTNNFEAVNKCKYLGVMLYKTGERDTVIEEKITAANNAYHANKNLL